MKSAFVTLLIISFLGVAFFGLALLLVALSLVVLSILPRPLNNDEDDDPAAGVFYNSLGWSLRPKISTLLIS